MELSGAEGKPSGLTFLSLLPFFRLPFQTWIFGRFLKFLLSLVRRDAMGHRRERERDGGCPSVAVSTQKPSLSPISPPSLLRQRRSPPSSCCPPFRASGRLPSPPPTNHTSKREEGPAAVGSRNSCSESVGPPPPSK